ncbi:MAG: hypothetical protein ACHQD8_00810, partial [Chitinophagales bacterium]
LFIGISYASAQDVYTSSGKAGYHKKTKKQKGYDPDKLIIGGGLNAGIGGGYANAGISPIVGYRFTHHFSAGIGLGYQYYQEPVYVDPNNPYKVSYIHDNIIYPNVWTRYFVYRNLFVDATLEYDFINQKAPGYDNYGNLTTVKLNVTNTCLLIGIGIKQPVGGRVSLFAELIYDVLQEPYSPYPQGVPDFRLGICAGL